MKIFRSASFWSHILILVLAVAVLYLPTLDFNFVLDDHAGIERNNKIGDMTKVLDQPLLAPYYLLLNAISSVNGLEPNGFRFFNILFHLGVVVAGYLLVLRITKSSATAFFSELLFAVHPILTESVVWISSMSYPAYSVFIILSLIFYNESRVRNNKYLLVPFFMSFVLALFSSEKALVLPFLIVIYEWLFGSIKKSWKVLAFGFLLVCFVAALLIFPFFSRIETFSATAVTGTTELMNPAIQIPTVLGTYINLIFWPQRLTVYHLDELGIQVVPLVLNSALLIAYLLGLVISYVKSKKIFFFLSVFLVASLPALIPIHVIQIAAERYAYLGTFGLITATVLALFMVVAKYKVNVIWLYALLLICALALAWRTTVRAKDWESEMSLRLATLSSAPYSARAHNNVGIQLMNEGDDEAALVKFNKSISLKPDYSHPYHNIGHMLALRGRYAEAEPFYLKAMAINKYEWKTRQDLGQVYFILKKYPEAKEQLTIAIEQGSPEVERLQTILNKIEELTAK